MKEFMFKVVLNNNTKLLLTVKAETESKAFVIAAQHPGCVDVLKVNL